jgi:hypothetical protein
VNLLTRRGSPSAKLAQILIGGICIALTTAAIIAADNAVVRREIQSVYNRASAAAVAARTLADLDAIHDWLDTPDCVFADYAQPRRTWTEMRGYANEGLRTGLKSFRSEITSLQVQGSVATTTALVRGVAVVKDEQGQFGAKGAVHEIETTATVRDVWVKSNTEWRRRSHDKIVNNHVTSVDGKPVQ